MKEDASMKPVKNVIAEVIGKPRHDVSPVGAALIRAAYAAAAKS